MTGTTTIDDRLDDLRRERAALAARLEARQGDLAAAYAGIASGTKRRPSDLDAIRGDIAVDSAELAAIDSALENESATRRAVERAEAEQEVAAIVERRVARRASLPAVAGRAREAFVDALEAVTALASLAEADYIDSGLEEVARDRAGLTERPEPSVPNLTPDMHILRSMVDDLERAIVRHR